MMHETHPRVLHITTVEFIAEKLLRPQLIFLQTAGFDIHIACAPSDATFAGSLQRFSPRLLAFPRQFRPIQVIRASKEMVALIRALKPHAVHFHGPAAALPGRLVMALRRESVPTVYTVHGFPHQWSNPSAADRILERAERQLSRWTNVMLFQSEEDLEQARRRGYCGALRYLGNGVEAEWFRPPSPRGGRQSPGTAVYVGRLTREKGVLDLIRAAADVPELTVTLIGEELPSDRDGVSAEARGLARMLNIERRVTFTGMLPTEEVRRRLPDFDFFVLPSWREGLPRSVIEAMASGLPIVTTNIRGCRELVTDGKEGWLIPPRDPQRLSAALRDAQRSSAATLDGMAAAAYAKAATRFREELVYSRLLDAYGEIGLRPQ